MTSIRTVLALLACLGLALQGCTALLGGAAGAGAAAYATGDLETSYQAPVDRTAQATLAALQQLDLQPAGSVPGSGNEVTIEGRRADGTPVRVWLGPAGDMTVGRIRVGTFGDTELSRQIDRRIVENLRTN
jgi:hypothetical protein